MTGLTINGNTYNVTLSTTALPAIVPTASSTDAASSAIANGLDALPIHGLGDLGYDENVYGYPMPKSLAYMLVLTPDTGSSTVNTAVMCQASGLDPLTCDAPSAAQPIGWTAVAPPNVGGTVAQVPSAPVQLGLFDATTDSYVSATAPAPDRFVSTDNYVYIQSATITPAAVPLPPSLVLFGSALVSLAGLRRKHRYEIFNRWH